MGRSIDAPILQSEIESFKKRAARVFPEGVERTAAILSSPSLRCRQTAKVLKNVLKLSREILDVKEFDETNYGKFEGLRSGEIKEQWPNLYRLWMNTPSQITFPGGETFHEVQERSYHKIQELLCEYLGKTEVLFVITHVDVIKMVIGKILSIPIDNKRYFCIDPGSFSLLESDEEEIRIKYLNRL